ncbi:MAG: hypothetical protein J5738_07505 [Lachnospiraceae bacterium]|nr:hypothetical protein [Lachnospiraceae bacterium]
MSDELNKIEEGEEFAQVTDESVSVLETDTGLRADFLDEIPGSADAEVIAKLEAEEELPEIFDDVEEEAEEMFLWGLRKEKRRRMRTILISLFVVGALVVGFFLRHYITMSEGWHRGSAGTYYVSDGERVTGLQLIDGTVYLFDEKGNILEGPAEADGKIYYATKEGIVKGVAEINGEPYYFSEEDGVLRRGFYTEKGIAYFRNSHGFAEPGVRTIDDRIYYCAEDGELIFGWTEFDEGIRYFRPADYTMATGIEPIEEESYLFDWNGYLQTGFIRDDEHCYYADENGVLAFGRTKIDGKDYYLADDGAALNGVTEADNSAWYFKDNQYCFGWIEDESGRYYGGVTGLYTGTHTLDGREYYFEEDYHLARGWITRGESKYYYDMEGIMLTGWQTIDDNQYCFADSGELYTGEREIAGVTYLFREDGVYYDGFVDTEIGHQYFVRGYLQTGVTKIEDKYYYLNKDGIPTGGMQKVDGLLAWYREDGSAETGWKTYENKKYYLGDNGVMRVGNNVIGGKRYYLSREGGFLAAGWHTDGGKFYSYQDGTMAVGAVRIDGVLYGFTDSGYLYAEAGLKKIGGKLRYVYADGKIAVNTEMTVSGRPYKIDANGVATVKFGQITEANLDEYLKYIVETEVGTKDIRSLYNWVRRKIPVYSYYSSDTKSARTLAIEALNRGNGACWHYAALMTLVLQAAGYDARVVKGGGHSYAVHHWTIVKQNGQWLHIDAMRFDASVFLVTDANLKNFKHWYTKSTIGPQKGKSGYTDNYYYGYTLP